MPSAVRVLIVETPSPLPSPRNFAFSLLFFVPFLPFFFFFFFLLSLYDVSANGIRSKRHGFNSALVTRRDRYAIQFPVQNFAISASTCHTVIFRNRRAVETRTMNQLQAPSIFTGDMQHVLLHRSKQRKSRRLIMFRIFTKIRTRLSKKSKTLSKLVSYIIQKLHVNGEISETWSKPVTFSLLSLSTVCRCNRSCTCCCYSLLIHAKGFCVTGL